MFNSPYSPVQKPTSAPNDTKKETNSFVKDNKPLGYGTIEQKTIQPLTKVEPLVDTGSCCLQ